MATTEQQQVLDSEGLKRDVGLLGLIWSSEGSMIGSGWLFGALLAVEIAGPAALIAWVIGSGIVVMLALVHAELGSLFPVTGGTSRFPHYAFGSLAGASFGWFSYIQAPATASIEVVAVIQYMSVASWAHGFFHANGTLSGSGLVIALALLLFFVAINLLGIRWLARANSSITTWKVLIPILAVVVLLLTHFHASNFTAGGGFFVHGPDGGVHSILAAISGGGIVFALTGFEQAVQLGGESINPSRNLPRAVIGSILIAAGIYLLVQFAFIGALDPGTLAHHSWADLANDTGLANAPFYTVTKVAGLTWLAWVLRVDAAVSPGGTGLIYTTTASRISYGLAKNGYVPAVFARTSAKTRVPVWGILFAFFVGAIFLLPFPSWSRLVSLITSAEVLMYAGAPLALGALRLQKPGLRRHYRLPAATVLAPLSFVLANFIVFWSGWVTVWKLMVVVLVGYLLMGLSAAFKLNDRRPPMDWAAAGWLFPYLIGMTVISYFGGFGGGKGGFLGGGRDDLPLWWDLLVLTVFSLVIYYLAMARRLPESRVDEYVRDVYPTAE